MFIDELNIHNLQSINISFNFTVTHPSIIHLYSKYLLIKWFIKHLIVNSVITYNYE